VFLSMLNRTILWDLLKIFSLSLVSITGLLLMAGVVKEAQNQGLGPLQILQIIPLIIPSTLPYTIPATTLFTTCVVYGRLANDNEILAIRAAGVNVLRVIWPALLLGLATTLITMVLYFSIIPMTFHLMKTMFLDDIDSLIYTKLKHDKSFSHPKLDYEVTVKRVQGKQLIEPIFKHKDMQSNKYDVVAWAQEAEIMVDKNNNQILIHMSNCYVTTDQVGDGVFIKDKWFPVEFPPDLGLDRKNRRSDMTWEELLARKATLQQEIEHAKAKVKFCIARLGLANPPENLDKYIHNLKVEEKYLHSQLLDVEAELVRRPALAVGCLCFVLVGCPVGIWFSRSDYLSAFVTCFLPIVLIYYPLVLCGENLARAGTVHPVPAIWAANAAFALVGLILYRRLLKN
jgi:lipopolysaccharide export system permease protein